MATKLPDFPDMGAVTLADAKRVAKDATSAPWKRMVSSYVNEALKALPRDDADRQAYEHSLTERLVKAEQRVAELTPIVAGTMPETRYGSTMTEGRARRVLRQKMQSDLECCCNGYVIAAVQALGADDDLRLAWEARMAAELAMETDIVETGPTTIGSLDAGPVPAP